LKKIDIKKIDPSSKIKKVKLDGTVKTTSIGDIVENINKVSRKTKKKPFEIKKINIKI